MKHLWLAKIFILSILINFSFSQTYLGAYAVQTDEGLLTLELQDMKAVPSLSLISIQPHNRMLIVDRGEVEVISGHRASAQAIIMPVIRKGM